MEFSDLIFLNVPKNTLLTKDQARRLPNDEIIIVINGEMPIKAKRLQYFADHKLKPLYESQDMKARAPMPPHVITEADYQHLPTVDDFQKKRR